MNNKLAPILVFAYKRLDSLILTIEALKKNQLSSASELYIFSDAARKLEDEKQVIQVRNYLKSISGFKTVKIFESTENKGLAKSIISGVTLTFESHNKVIVVEDDLVTTTNFLSYMNNALHEYEQKNKVFSIAGYSFNLTKKNTDYPEDAYFITRGWPWGWATWKDRWENVDWEVKDYEQFKKDKKAQKAFAKGGSDVNSMLRKQMEGKLDSWAIRWFYHQFKVGGLTLYPLFSKVHNIGFDEYATHTKGSDNRYVPNMDISGNTSFKLPELIEENPIFQKRFQNKMGIKRRIWGKIETLLQKFF